MQIGYARVSTAEQQLDPQTDELRRAGCEKIFTDTASGARAQRPGLDELLSQVRRGDVVVVVRLDRLGRSLAHLVETVARLERAKVGFRSLAESLDSTTAAGKLILHVFGSLAEFERALIVERTNAGLSSARARGRIGGRPRDTDTRRQKLAAALLSDPGNSIEDVCRVLKVSKATAYRLAAKGRELHQQPPAATMPAEAPGRPVRQGKPIRAATSTDQERTRAERGKPRAAAQSGEKAASSPKQPAQATARAKTIHQPTKSQKPTNKKRK